MIKVGIYLASLQGISYRGSGQRFTIGGNLRLHLKELVFLAEKETQGNSR